ncbi:MAG: folate-binding protein [Actinobacteria bacterium]|nr:folate-binding protein [Actinomycetota bacterium]
MTALRSQGVPHPDLNHPDSGVAWHYGDPHGEQRRLEGGGGYVDLSQRGVLTVTGPDRLTWLHSLLSQSIEHLQPGESALSLLLDPHGRVEHELHIIDDGEVTWITTESTATQQVRTFLDSMRFMLRVEIADVSDAYAVVWQPVRVVDDNFPTWLVPEAFAGLPAPDAGGEWNRLLAERPALLVGREVIVSRAELDTFLDSAGQPAGTWALEALRIAAGVPRVGLDTDTRTIPNEVGWLGSAVHLSKGCYRGQETVARTHNLGRPPRRLVLLHLDGTEERLPAQGTLVTLDDKTVGTVGSSARHHELGPIALALVKRSVAIDAVLLADGISASQQPIIIG